MPEILQNFRLQDGVNIVTILPWKTNQMEQHEIYKLFSLENSQFSIKHDQQFPDALSTVQNSS